MYKGPREEGVDYFDDVLGDNEEAGVLEGGGLRDYDRVREKISPEGLNAEMQCRLCGKRASVTLEWLELFVCGSNGPGQPLIMPKGWQYSQNNGTMFCAIRCGKCSDGGYYPHVTPDEARRYVNAAVARGFVSQQALQQWKAGVDMARQSGAQYAG
jgi:hypothetical protein